MRIPYALLLALLLTTAFTAPIHAEETADVETSDVVKYKLTTGADYSRGDYGDTEDTEVWYVPVTGKAMYGNWTAKVTVPYLRIKGPGAVVGGGDGSVTQSGGTAITTEEGLGDIIAALGYTFDFDDYGTSIDVIGKIKLPTGDEDKGLSTGEVDYKMELGVTKTIDKFTLVTALSRKFVGTNPTLNLHNTWGAEAGFIYKINSDLSTGLGYEWRQSSSGSSQPREASLYFDYKLTPKINVQLYGNKGFSDGSADAGGGLMVGYKF